MKSPTQVNCHRHRHTQRAKDAEQAPAKIGNGLAAKLRAQLGPTYDETNAPTGIKDPSQPPPGVSPIEVISELQQYASTIRDINSRAEQLDWFIGGVATEYHLENLKQLQQTNASAGYKEFQLPVGLPNLWEAESERTKLYQHVRTFGQNVVDDVATVYGALGSKPKSVGFWPGTSASSNWSSSSGPSRPPSMRMERKDAIT